MCFGRPICNSALPPVPAFAAFPLSLSTSVLVFHHNLARRVSGKVKEASSCIFQELPSRKNLLLKSLPCSLARHPQDREDRRGDTEAGPGSLPHTAWKASRAPGNKGSLNASSSRDRLKGCLISANPFLPLPLPPFLLLL